MTGPRRALILGGLVVLLSLPVRGTSQGQGPTPAGPVIEARPVAGVTVGPGKKLWVFVFPERGKGKGGPPGGGVDPCLNTDQSQFKLLSFRPQDLTFHINPGSVPLDPPAGAIQAIHDAFNAWNGAAGRTVFSVADAGGASGPAEDGIPSVGWIRIVPRNTLAATWIWTETIDDVDYLTEADIFFNLSQPWGAFTTCNDQNVFEVGNVATHEVGHAMGLAHISDAAAQATMYPSAPRGEVKKRTLTTGDTDGALAAQ